MGRERTDGRGPETCLARTRFARLVVACPTHALSRPACVSASTLFHLSVPAPLPPPCLEMAVLGLIGRGDAQTSQTCCLHLGRFATQDTGNTGASGCHTRHTPVSGSKGSRRPLLDR